MLPNAETPYVSFSRENQNSFIFLYLAYFPRYKRFNVSPQKIFQNSGFFVCIKRYHYKIICTLFQVEHKNTLL